MNTRRQNLVLQYSHLLWNHCWYQHAWDYWNILNYQLCLRLIDFADCINFQLTSFDVSSLSFPSARTNTQSIWARDLFKLLNIHHLNLACQMEVPKLWRFFLNLFDHKQKLMHYNLKGTDRQLACLLFRTFLLEIYSPQQRNRKYSFQYCL